MNNRRLFCAAAVLSLALSIPAYAGDVQTPAIAVPPPPATSANAPVGAQPSSSTGLLDLLLDLLGLD